MDTCSSLIVSHLLNTKYLPIDSFLIIEEISLCVVFFLFLHRRHCKNNMVIPIESPEVLPMTNVRVKKGSDGQKSFLKMKRSLIERKELHFRCCRTNDLMCIIALLGLILMIVDTEFRFKRIFITATMFIRPAISISTIILIGLVIYYHVLDVRLYAINNHIADWRVTLTLRGLLMIVCEIVVCSIHPFPYINKFAVLDNIPWLQMFLTLPSESLVFVIDICCF